MLLYSIPRAVEVQVQDTRRRGDEGCDDGGPVHHDRMQAYWSHTFARSMSVRHSLVAGTPCVQRILRDGTSHATIIISCLDSLYKMSMDLRVPRTCVC